MVDALHGDFTSLSMQFMLILRIFFLDLTLFLGSKVIYPFPYMHKIDKCFTVFLEKKISVWRNTDVTTVIETLR